MFIIIDWTGRVIDFFGEFKTWDDAESYLSDFLNDKYETDRQEFYIVEKSEAKNA